MYSEKHIQTEMFWNDDIGMSIPNHPEIKIDICGIDCVKEHLFGDKTSNVDFLIGNRESVEEINVFNAIVNLN